MARTKYPSNFLVVCVSLLIAAGIIYGQFTPPGGGGGGGGATGPSGPKGAPGFPLLPNTGTGANTINNLPTSGWTPVNGALLNDFSSSITGVTSIDTSSQNWRFIRRALTVPYTLYAAVEMVSTQCNSQTAGIFLTDGTKLEIIELLSQNTGGYQLRIETAANVTTDSGSVVDPAPGLIGRYFAVKIVNNSTNRVFSYWSNGAWVQLLSEASGTFLVENGAGPGGVSVNCGTNQLEETRLLYWNVQ